MKYQVRVLFLAVLMVLGDSVCAGNAALSQASTVPTGERIANYLQAVMFSAGEVVTARSPGDIFSPKEPFHLSFNYDPEAQVIDVYITGKLEKTEDIKPIFDLTQKIILRLNNKIKKFYGVTLNVEDLSMDYMNIEKGKVIMKFLNGQYVNKTLTEAVSTPAIFSTQTND